MTSEPARLVELAAAAADGSAVDWERELECTEDPGERKVVRALGFLANVVDMHERLHTPKRWGAFEVLDEIGRGAHATVYRARDPRLDRTVALKLWPAPPESSEGVVAEGRMLARVRHPSVVTVYGAEYCEGRLGLWMEHVDGVTLTDLVRERGTFGPSEVVSMAIDLCGALAAVHAAGLVHGDVKAHNVMRASGGRLVLMDFGIGQYLGDASAAGEGSVVSGTPLFMAPELIAGAAKSVESDIYALGVLVYHLLTGRYPVEATSVSELRAAHAAGKTTPLRDLRPDLPGPLVDVVTRTLAPDPSRRYSSAGTLEQALVELRGPAARAALPTGTPSVPPRRRPALAVAALATVALALLVALGSFLLRPQVESVAVPTARPTVPVGTGAPSFAAEVETHFYRAAMTADELLIDGMRVRPGDRLYLTVRAREPVHVYVVNLDRSGRGYLLFPLPEAGAVNPLQAGSAHRLPGDIGATYDSWEVSSAGGRESMIVVAARGPLAGFERLLSRLEPATPSVPQELGVDLVDALRGVGALSRSGVAEDDSPEAAEVADALRALAASPLTRDQVVVREIELDNP